jgi:protein-S-isoprenylcysteine O-methyltransferase Ste14
MFFDISFEIGLWNAWLFMIWIILFPILSSFIIKNKNKSRRVSVSVPVKFEKTLNWLSMFAVIFGFIYSIFLPLNFVSILFYFGLSIFIIGFLISILIINIIKNTSVNKPLVKGPYRFSRHPIYLSHFLILFSIFLMTISWIFLIILFIVLIHIFIVIPAEEKFCIDKFGEEYIKYCENTPRWFGLHKNR